MPVEARAEGGDAHVLPVRVYYEDTDAQAIVYHAAYLRFAERGRTELLRALGFTSREAAFAAVECAMRFHRPARLDDLLDVRTRPESLGGATVSLRQEIRRDGELLVAIRIRLACVDGAGRPRRLPAGLRHAFAAMPYKMGKDQPFDG